MTMTCPECGGEYREGFTTCADCGGPLLAAGPPGEEPEGVPSPWTLVLATGDPGLVGLAESILAAAEIPYTKVNEALQDLFAYGRLGLGYNPIVGPIGILVPPDRAEEARESLGALERAEMEEGGEVEVEDEGEEVEPS
jgi:hypothetical protein